MLSLTHSAVHSAVHSLTPSHSLTHSLTDSLTQSPTHSLTHSLTHACTQACTHVDPTMSITNCAHGSANRHKLLSCTSCQCGDFGKVSNEQRRWTQPASRLSGFLTTTCGILQAASVGAEPTMLFKKLICIAGMTVTARPVGNRVSSRLALWLLHQQP